MKRDKSVYGKCVITPIFKGNAYPIYYISINVKQNWTLLLFCIYLNILPKTIFLQTYVV